MDRLPVYFETREVGWITAADEASAFTYAESWRGLTGAFPVSLTMPLSRASHDASAILPWAANLLPENATLGTVGHMLGKSPDDIIGLPAEMGRDIAGALSVGQAGTGLIAGKGREIPDKASLERILNELPHRPFLVGEDGVSMSLAGVQTKLAVALDGDTLYIPIDGAPSTHIIKPDGELLPGAVQNEAFCLTLARMIGIPTPKVTTGTAGERSYLLVERYDRRRDGKRWRRLHQEDFCQAFGRPPAAKHQNNDRGLKGPSLADMIGLTQRHMTAQDTARFVDLAIFNPMVWNTDSPALADAIGARRRHGARLRHRLCGAISEDHPQHGAEDRRAETGRPARTRSLGARRHRLQALSSADDPARLRDCSGRHAPCNGGRGRGRSHASRRRSRPGHGGRGGDFAHTRLPRAPKASGSSAGRRSSPNALGLDACRGESRARLPRRLTWLHIVLKAHGTARAGVLAEIDHSGFQSRPLKLHTVVILTPTTIARTYLWTPPEWR
ncbi:MULTISPECIES: HipA domain-containing protein [unclassified Bradyrhizobium]|uniref:HipA domain-containing protein n=1 Tax=unclassified Bradyrhizobium TaxID=2631580 RepID=UPI00247ABF95|nr:MULTISPECIES: HipA domain-containing protein [unclassified Bradyrhizobium]WGR73057.1 HipA domain-containing protein [Bradyrhizobium sp. ISRA426]WGR77894.1 HipA domain-containing protein [Bradyrhizobium sp. ISRA430]WGR88297.1 HipA domain-containing protein [Bradyrhizobium sp. ISRA432]